MAIFLYTPLPYWGVFVVGSLQDDFSRLFHPFRDDGSAIRWWSVLRPLGLLDAAQVAQRPWSARGVLPYLVTLRICGNSELELDL